MIIRKWTYTDIALIAEFQKKHFIDYWTYSQLADGFLSGRLSGYIVEKDGDFYVVDGVASALAFALSFATFVDCELISGELPNTKFVKMSNSL